MSIVTVIRDYVEFLNNFSESLAGVIPITEFLKETTLYFIKTIQWFFMYLISFQWIRDFTLLPITIPQVSASLLREKFFLEGSANVFFSFLEIPNLRQNSFVLGFFNSLGLTFPVSIIHILTIRRLYIKGIPSAVFSISGYLVGQLIFIASVIFGLRALIIPWFTLEPLNYILGLVLVFRLVYTMRQESLRELSGWNQPQYLNSFLTNFVIAWCEQTTMYQYVGNLNFAPTSSLLDIQGFGTVFNTLFAHTSYLFGLALGCVIFTIIWGFLLLQFKNLCIRYTPLFLSKFVQTINTGSFVLATALCLSSLPFYGLDYLVTGPIGFVSQDKVFKNTVLDQYNVKDSVLGLGSSSQFTSLDIDITPFDRGRYLIFPEKTLPVSFEDVNYKGEYEWTTRYDKLSTISDSRASALSLAKLFKKQIGDDTPKIEDTESALPIQSRVGNETLSQPEFEIKNPRFEEWYLLDANISPTEGTPLENIFVDAQDTAFPLDFFRIYSLEPGNIDLKIKQKYYSNPVYRNLLSLDIDLLLNRQPKEFKLDKKDEVDLYTKRRVLTAYYDSLRSYAKLPYSEDFENFFQGTKSFTNKVYNQQFKGTLRSVCRLFSLTSDSDDLRNTKQLVLKYDQPLYTFGKKSTFTSYHEELVPNTKKASPFLQDVVSGPLYAGWDEKLRKFVITNKFLPRTLTGYKTILNTAVTNKFVKSDTLKDAKVDSGSSYRIKFSVWPLKQQTISESQTSKRVPFTALYIPQTESGTAADPAFDTLSTIPSNWETRTRRSTSGLGQTYEDIFEYLAPHRGGFIWPGNPKLQVNIRK